MPDSIRGVGDELPNWVDGLQELMPKAPVEKTTDADSPGEDGDPQDAKRNSDELHGTAWHEAAHAVAGKVKKYGVERVQVISQESGHTSIIDEQSISEEDLILLALVGIYGESSTRTAFTIEEAVDMLIGASGDRELSARCRQYWHSQSSNWHQRVHHEAEKFVQDHKKEIAAVANALLAKPGFPKVLTTEELDDCLNEV